MSRSPARAGSGRDRPSLYQEITDKIIAELEAGRVPWVQTLNDYARETDPFAKIGARTVTVEVISVVRASGDSFELRWKESAYENGAIATAERFTGVLTVILKTPNTPETLRKNPLGLYVHSLNWSRDLIAEEKK